MQVGDQVVCIDSLSDLVRGETYTIRDISNTTGVSLLLLDGKDWGRYPSRFRLLEEMQNTNFVSLV